MVDKEIIIKNILKKRLDTKQENPNNDVDMLISTYPVFKLKKKKIKNKKHRLVKNTKKYSFYIKGLVPVSTGLRISNDDSKDDGYNWCINVRWCTDTTFTTKV